MKANILTLLALLVSALGLRAACVEITCPADIVTGCTGSSGAAVSFSPDAKSTCGTEITVACIPPSGTVFPIGTNSVSCAVTDERDDNDRCVFRVIVTNAPPVIECPEDIVAECLGPNGAIVGFNPVASAGCDAPVNVVCIPPSGSVFPIGTNSVGCVATDDFGRTARCTFFVIVTNAPPSITCSRDMQLTADATCKAVLPLIPVTVIERCTPSNQLAFAQFPPAGTLLPIGDHTITVFVGEGNHLDATCTMTVYVVDGIAPQIKCPGQVLAHCAPEGTNVFFNVEATDTCDGTVAAICAPPSGSFFPNGSTIVTCIASDAAGNTNQCSFGVNVMSAPPTLTYIAGSKDNYALPADPTSKSACLVTAMTGIPTISEFDQNFAGRWLGHSFENLPGGIQSATLRLHMKPKGNTSSNDVLRIGLTNCVAGAQWAWSSPIKSLPLMGGVWTTNGSTHITFDLSAMPGSPVALLPLLGIDQTHRLDISIGEDTVVDWFELKVTTCQASGAAGGVPYMLKQGESIPGPDDSIEFSSDGELPFDVDLNLGKAEGVVIELGDDWPGATNPPISECTTTASSLQPMKIEWKPAGDLLCTVRFMYDIVPDYIDVLLTQPTNISGGRAIEVWRDGQMVSRYFHEEGSGPIDASGVVLPHDACVLSMGFGIGDFFMELQEEVPIWFAFAKHVSGEESPVMGDFVRLIFNVPMTVGGGGDVRFDPDLVLNIQGQELDVRAIKVRKFGGLFETSGAIFSIGDDVSVVPAAENGLSKTCYEPTISPEKWNSTKHIALSLADLFGGQNLMPGAAFDIEATGEVGTTPPSTAVIGRLRCEIVSVNPLVTRFRANYSDSYLYTQVALFGDFFADAVQSNEVLVVQGGPESLWLFVADNFANFALMFDNGVDVVADSEPFANVETAWFMPFLPPIGLHHAPYKFCVTRLQAWENIPITFYDPLPSRPAPAAPLTTCVSVEAPAKMVRWSAKGEDIPVRFDVKAETTCGRDVRVTCIPPSGSPFSPGVTFVSCQAVDDLGYSARCRFPVAVYEGEPRVSIERAGNGQIAIVLPAEFVPAEFLPAEFLPAEFLPAEFHAWELEASDELSAPHWENLGPATKMDDVSWTWLLRAVKTAQFFRLRAP